MSKGNGVSVSPLCVYQKPTTWLDAKLAYDKAAERHALGQVSNDVLERARKDKEELMEQEMLRLRSQNEQLSAKVATGGAGNKPAVTLGADGCILLKRGSGPGLPDKERVTQYLRRVLAVEDVLALARSVKTETAREETVTTKRKDKDGKAITYKQIVCDLQDGRKIVVGYKLEDAQGLRSLISEVESLFGKGGAA